MTSEKEPKISIIKTHELLSKAQLLLRDLQELLDWCTSTDNSTQTWHKMIQQDSQITREDKYDTLVIEGFRFESGQQGEPAEAVFTGWLRMSLQESDS